MWLGTILHSCLNSRDGWLESTPVSSAAVFDGVVECVVHGGCACDLLWKVEDEEDKCFEITGMDAVGRVGDVSFRTSWTILMWTCTLKELVSLVRLDSVSLMTYSLSLVRASLRTWSIST